MSEIWEVGLGLPNWILLSKILFWKGFSTLVNSFKASSLDNPFTLL